MIINFIVTFVISRLTPPPPSDVQDMVARLRSPEGNGTFLRDLGEEELD
ncbi:MAG: hypothetical protein QNJ70_00315 [Xenococcaceae cyanobacterium MO_207.B15]|nr:hypothetical protein [Xenococcaceae cyanobacterium MO_207.B15]